MKRVYEETTRSDAFIALGVAVTALHNIVMSDECGIQHYKTDFLHDLMGIMKQLVELDDKHKESKLAFSYSHVIGTRESGTYNAMNEVEREYWLPSTIKGVGINIFRKQNGGNIETEIWLLEPDEIREFATRELLTFEVWAIDAWCNDEDGWWWNDRSKVGEFDATFDDAESGFVNFAMPYRLGIDDLEFDWYSENECEVRNKQTDKPLYQIALKCMREFNSHYTA